MKPRLARTRATSRPKGLLVLLPLIGLLALAGCSPSVQAGIATAGQPAPVASGAPAPDPTSTADVAEQQLAFAACMRDNGVPMPDPGSDQGPGQRGGFRAFGDVDPDVLNTAMQACDSLRPSGGGRNLADLSDADQQKMLDVAACLRDEGYAVPDPTFDGQGGFLRPTPGSTFSPRDDGYRAAMDTCRTEAGLDLGPGNRGGASSAPSAATA